ncbi:DNA methyltransferase [Leptolyngbya sp. AN10]|uniref:DNA methyltransferase n=1 Tax=Leptolyngbya sp. AN10 TaxID=3423365 RepID=UPI003D32111D
MSASPQLLQEFVDYSKQYIHGNEEADSQSFLNAFFRAFGHNGAKEAGAEFERKIDKSSAKGNKGSADLVWKDRVLIEMKSRGKDLQKYYNQMERYWMRLTPKPKYCILCNFDEFWIYDFNHQVDTPVDKIHIDEFVQRSTAFKFMERGNYAPIFRNNQVEITSKAAVRMGQLYQDLIQVARWRKFRDYDEAQAQRFVLQCVLAMFAEDRGLLPSGMFISCIQDCIEKRGRTYDIIGGLFHAMNQKGTTPAGRYAGTAYFNGGLFSIVHPIELRDVDLELLLKCAEQDWKQVRPSVFGSIFEGTSNAKERRAHGMHFTSEGDIREIVIPTITEYWEELIDEANTEKELHTLHHKLSNYRTLDAACGSGNFLYVAYQELKKVEKRLINKLCAMQGTDNQQLLLGRVTPNQFFGMDTNSFGVELARVTMMIARKIAIDTLELHEPALPLDTLDNNIVCADALFTDWVKADAIIGNPPFLGGKNARKALGDDYMDRVFAKFPGIKDSVDFCSYWFRRTHDALDEGGRAGLVGTNSISQGKTRAASLDYITQNGGHIHTAISSQPWSGEAAVHVSIVNWSKQEPKRYRLDRREVSQITSSLTSTVDVSGAVRLKANQNVAFQGIIPVGKGFYVSRELANSWILKDPKNRKILKQSSSASDLTDVPNGSPSRWIIDFNDMSIEEASEYELPFEHVRTYVKPERDNNRRETTKLHWWKFGEKRPAMRKALASLSCYFSVPRHSKWFIFIPVSPQYLPADSATIVASDDFYVLGIITSSVHRAWVKAQSSTLEDRTRYTHNTCFETFPFPQNVTAELVDQIRATTQDLHDYRSQRMEGRGYGITDLYNQFFDEPTSQLAKLHQKLDDLVMEAYGFGKNDDILEKLLNLNLRLAELEKQEKKVVGAWAL